MTHTTRRIFIARTLAGGCAVAGASLATPAAPATHVEETDDTAVALGYHHDTRQADAKKYPQPHRAAALCRLRVFWQGAASDAWAGCAMFGRKQVAAGGWCSAFSKKPG